MGVMSWHISLGMLCFEVWFLSAWENTQPGWNMYMHILAYKFLCITFTCCLLRYFWYLNCDEIWLEADTALPKLYAAKKYTMPHLAGDCVEFLVTNVEASNGRLLLSHSRLFDETELKQRCLGVIDSQSAEVLQSESFTGIDYKTLKQILIRGTLCVDEAIVYAAACRWAEAECTRQGRDISPQQCREVLGDALYLLGFPQWHWMTLLMGLHSPSS